MGEGGTYGNEDRWRKGKAADASLKGSGCVGLDSFRACPYLRKEEGIHRV